MNFSALTQTIQQTHETLRKKALSVVDQSLTIRNWMIGFYIVEFEQNGVDRAEYGERLMVHLAKELKRMKMKGLAARSLYNTKEFYLTYPQFGQWMIKKGSINILQTLSAKFQYADSQHVDSVLHSPAPELLIRHFSYSHFLELIKIKEPIRRIFYETQGISGAWSVRQLKRQIESLLYERTGISADKGGLIEMENDQEPILNIADTIRDPYILEFTGLMEKGFYSESDLETALLDHIQDFLLELGNGFCFEARQRRISMDNEHDRVDLVFYHRILKCHVLIDLKVRKFSHADAGQMNFYLNYYRNHVVSKGDNPPIGIVLCTDKHETKAEYATAGLDSQVFVSKYKINLPSESELQAFVQENLERIELYGDQDFAEEDQAPYGVSPTYRYRRKYAVPSGRVSYQSSL